MTPAEIVKRVNEHAPDHGADCGCELTPMIDTISSALEALGEIVAQFASVTAMHPDIEAALGLAPQAHVTGAGVGVGDEGGASTRARRAYFTSDEIRDITARIPDQMRQWDQMRKGGHVVAPHEHQWFEETTYGDRADGFTEVTKCSICGKEEKR